MTMVARVVDGLPLVGTMQDDEQVQRMLQISFPQWLLKLSLSFTVWEKCFGIPKSSENVISKAGTTFTTKMFNRNWTLLIPVSSSFSGHTIDRFISPLEIVIRVSYSYLIESDVCYLVMCDKLYSKRLAFNYLEDIAQEFHKNYGRKVNSVTRPYAFIEFDVYIQKAKKQLTDRRRNINTINNQLQDVQRIMVI